MSTQRHIRGMLAYLLSIGQRESYWEPNVDKTKHRDTKKTHRRKKAPKTFGRRKHLKKHKSYRR